MHEFTGRTDCAAVVFTNCLMTQADADDWHFTTTQPDQFDHATRFMRCTGTGGEHQYRIIFACHDLLVNLLCRQIVTVDFDGMTEAAELINQVIGKRIEVIQQKNSIKHGLSPCLPGQPVSPAR